MCCRLILFVMILFSMPGYAVSWGSDCNYTIKESIINLPAGVNISIDPNMPVGTVFYESLFSVPVSGSFICKTAVNLTQRTGFQYESGGSTLMMSGYGLNGTYPVYKTNVDGVGVVVRVGATAIPYLGSPKNVTARYNTVWPSYSIDIDLIKYADIPRGPNTIEISSLSMPDIDFIVNVSNSSDAEKIPNGDIPLVKLKFATASFDILTSTCDTPNQNINMGSYQLGDSANREGGKFATRWVDASILLTNCPTFYGTGERGDSYKNATRDNVMTVTLIPSNPTSSTQGIMPVDTSGLAASGVGLQLAYGTSDSPQLVDFSAGKGTKTYTMSSTQGSTYTIPLVARYIQTATSISDINAGHANGKITYLIDYY